MIRIPTSFFLLIILSSLAIGVHAQKKKAKAKVDRPKTVVTYRPATDDERRRDIEARMLKGEYHHDGSGELMYIGTIESVPALLQVLKANPPYVEKVEPLPPPAPGRPPHPPQPPPKKWFICTYAHAVAALRKITGQKFTEYEDWLAWWEANKK